jgi:hypothetical protein
MATNENGRLLDDGGNVVVDHIWGNMPMQPNDVRIENGGAVLDPALDNHGIVYAGWNGYPLYTPNTTGEGVGNIVVPNVLGLTTANALEVLIDAGFLADDITTASAYTPAVNNVELTSDVATLTTAAAHGFAVGDSVVIAGLTATQFNGTFTLIAGTTGSTLVYALVDPTDVVSTADSGTAKVAAKAGRIFSQSLAAGADSVEAGDAITVTPYYAS